MFLLRREGVARRLFSQQLISALAKGGCGGPNGLEGLKACQESVREKKKKERKRERGVGGTRAKEISSADFIFMTSKPQ